MTQPERLTFSWLAAFSYGDIEWRRDLLLGSSGGFIPLFFEGAMKAISNVFSGLLAAGAVVAGLSSAVGAEETAPKGFDRVREVPRGKVTTETYQSKSLGFERKLTVYTPPGYNKEEKYLVALRLFKDR